MVFVVLVCDGWVFGFHFLVIVLLVVLVICGGFGLVFGCGICVLWM